MSLGNGLVGTRKEECERVEKLCGEIVTLRLEVQREKGVEGKEGRVNESRGERLPLNYIWIF